MNIVLGGTHGLGAEVATCLRAGGDETFVVGRTYDPVLHGEGMAVDLAEANKVAKLTQYIHELPAGRLKGFYWVAGFGDVVQPEFAKQTGVYEMALANFANALPPVQAAWQKLAEQGGNLVVVSSTTGVTPRKDEAVYAATKFAQVGFAQSLGLEAESLDLPVRVALFLPGGMRTPFWDENPPENYDSYLDPRLVAGKMIDAVQTQTDYYYEEKIPRGSL